MVGTKAKELIGMRDEKVSIGQVFIVGAGPGDPDLITVRGQKLLASADVVLYTGSLVPEYMLDYCQPEVERIDTRSLVLETWWSLVLERVQAGKIVVRLQDGDPSLYGALHELMVHLWQHEIPFEVVPGVSAFQAAAARLQVELTIPNLVQSIILTRTQGQTDVPSTEDLASLASHQASLCLYLSAHHCTKAQEQLLSHYPPETTMALCYRLGWPDEYVRIGRLDEMAQMTREAKLNRTVLYIVSPALKGRPEARSQLYSPGHTHIFRTHQTA
ncbi:MAG: precorrin-4 C(11)-methyltransferase [Gloeobacterales cyanobacterium]